MSRIMFNIMDLSGKILKVDLTTQQVKIVEGEEELYRNFLSGRGLSQFLLFKNVKPEVSSLDSRNVLLLGAGLLVGTTVPGAVRLSVDTKNFFSGGVGSANAGGNFARELKSAGIGIIMVAGRAKQPVYIAVVGRKVTIRDATNLWGRTVSETDDVIRAELGKKAKVLCIGPAGENLVRGACVIVDKARAAAKCGVGAVM
ncbi:aldehyde ferredoxin oxidoreductase, partial [bacterium]|nr:aldehyde ferredoxin oxidoreductase [bacterium]